MDKDLARIFPLQAVEDDCILSRQGDITVAFQVQLPEIFSLSGQQYEILHQAWVRAIRAVPCPGVLHKQDWFTQRNIRGDFSHDDAGLLASGSERYFHERPWLDHECLILLTRKPNSRKPSSSGATGLIRSSVVPWDLLDDKGIKEFLDSAGQFRQILEDSGLVKLVRLKNGDLLSSPGKSGWIERYCFLTEDPANPLIRDINLEKELHIGDQQVQIFTLSDPPSLPALCGPRLDYEKYSTEQSRFSIGFVSGLGMLLPCNHIYNQFLFMEEPGRIIRGLERKGRRLHSLAAYSRENASSGEAVRDFLDEAVRNQQQPVRAHFNIMVWAENREQLGEIRKRVMAALAGLHTDIKQESVGAPQLFWAALPGNAGDFPMNESFITFAGPAISLLGMESKSRSSEGSFGIRLGDRLSGKPLLVDISDEPLKRGICSNRNKFILGPSGSGKSFFTNHLVRSYHEQGAHIVLVDTGHSYQGLCELVNGYYFTYDDLHPIRFNPFFRIPGEPPDTEKRESLKALLLALWKKEDEGFNRAEYILLSDALQSYDRFILAHPDVFPGFNSFYEFLGGEFARGMGSGQPRSRDADLDSLLYVLRPYYGEGEFGFLLNATENLDLLDQSFIVFELDQIKDHPILFPVVTIIIMEVFISKMRRLKGKRKMILIEEAWKAIAREGMAEYIRYLFKTVRKYFGEAVVVTQEVEDILDSPVVKQAILNNSDCRILLDQSKYLNRFDQIQQLLGLTEHEKSLVLSLNRANDPGYLYREVFISLGGVHSRVYRTEVSPEEYLTYTTEEREKIRVQEATEQYGGDRQKAIAVLARKMRMGDQAGQEQRK
ncbi:MAG TPA: TraG family conjugative transposon ATPase [Chitinophagaceae bacterium]|nr:TraG family conjugative transposon ATPase [Chitinophagaceae bacterium]